MATAPPPKPYRNNMPYNPSKPAQKNTMPYDSSKPAQRTPVSATRSKSSTSKNPAPPRKSRGRSF